MKSLRYIAILLAWIGVCNLSAKSDPEKWAEWGPASKHNMGLILRAGYTIGGTMPLPIPGEIRGVNAFEPRGGFQAGVEGYKMFTKRVGASIGLYYSFQGFYTSANVKNYYLSYQDGENLTSGWFTGCNDTEYKTTGILIPLLATFRLSPRWNLSFGPYIQLLMEKHFKGSVYDNKDGVGYLRVDEMDENGNSLGLGPTGQKVLMTSENPVVYDLSEDMSGYNAGLELMFDWKALKHFNLFGKLDWGLTSAFPSDFGAVRFKMYPIYGTLGAAYRF